MTNIRLGCQISIKFSGKKDICWLELLAQFICLIFSISKQNSDLVLASLTELVFMNAESLILSCTLAQSNASSCMQSRILP